MWEETGQRAGQLPLDLVKTSGDFEHESEGRQRGWGARLPRAEA